MNRFLEKETTSATCQQYQTLLAVGEAIVAHREMKPLLHDLADRLREVVRFDGIVLVRYDAQNNLLHRHVFDHAEPLPAEPPMVFAFEDDPGGLVLEGKLVRVHVEAKRRVTLCRKPPLRRAVSARSPWALTP